MAKAARVIGKVDLVGNVAQITELTKENAKKATNAVLEGVQALLQQSGKIQLAKFGSFTIRKTKSRRGRNPQTSQPMLIPPGVRIAFKVSKTWKDAVLRGSMNSSRTRSESTPLKKRLRRSRQPGPRRNHHLNQWANRQLNPPPRERSW